MRRTQIKKTRKIPEELVNLPQMPEYKPVEVSYNSEEYERKMAEINKRIDKVISSNSEEFVINFRQIEGE